MRTSIGIKIRFIRAAVGEMARIRARVVGRNTTHKSRGIGRIIQAPVGKRCPIGSRIKATDSAGRGAIRARPMAITKMGFACHEKRFEAGVVCVCAHFAGTGRPGTAFALAHCTARTTALACRRRPYLRNNKQVVTESDLLLRKA